jgi:hypothetical protein
VSDASRDGFGMVWWVLVVVVTSSLEVERFMVNWSRLVLLLLFLDLREDEEEDEGDWCDVHAGEDT